MFCSVGDIFIVLVCDGFEVSIDVVLEVFLGVIVNFFVVGIGYWNSLESIFFIDWELSFEGLGKEKELFG